MQDSTERLLEHLYRSGTGDDKLAKIKAIVAANPTVGVSSLIEAMRDVVPAGTVRKCEEWASDPSLTLPPRERRSAGEMVAESAAIYNRKHEVTHVEPTHRS